MAVVLRVRDGVSISRVPLQIGLEVRQLWQIVIVDVVSRLLVSVVKVLGWVAVVARAAGDLVIILRVDLRNKIIRSQRVSCHRPSLSLRFHLGEREWVHLSFLALKPDRGGGSDQSQGECE